MLIARYSVSAGYRHLSLRSSRHVKVNRGINMCELLFDKCKCINVAWNSGLESIGPQAEVVSGIHLIELAIVAAGARDMASHFHLELLGENEAGTKQQW